MPHIQITMLKGRTIEQKRKLVERVTDAMAEEAGTPKEGIVVTIVEVEREDYARGGVLMADKKQ
jgi:4-oxalocrotonate tautomerase